MGAVEEVQCKAVASASGFGLKLLKLAVGRKADGHIRETRTNWNYLCLSPASTSATGLTCSRNCAPLHYATYPPTPPARTQRSQTAAPTTRPDHRSEWICRGALPSIDLHSTEKVCSFASALQTLHICFVPPLTWRHTGREFWKAELLLR